MNITPPTALLPGTFGFYRLRRFDDVAWRGLILPFLNREMKGVSVY
jgi:hypothetical protein